MRDLEQHFWSGSIIKQQCQNYKRLHVIFGQLTKIISDKGSDVTSNPVEWITHRVDGILSFYARWSVWPIWQVE